MATKAHTAAQVVVDFSTGELPYSSRFSFAKARAMRLDPTIALAREFAIAPILASSWAVEGDDPEHRALIEANLQPLRTHLLRTALFGEFDFGWKAYEKTFTTKPLEMPDGTTREMTCIDAIKPLRNDDTYARYDRATGDFLGLRTTSPYDGIKINIDAAHSLFVNFDDEGLGNYAEGRMQRLESAYDQWNDANEGAARYDQKMAGSFLVVHYPVGTTPFNGSDTDNATIAGEVIKALRSSGSVSIPVDLNDVVQQAQAGANGWRIEFLDPQSKQANFRDRLAYLDALKARGSAVPERAILEGEFGTKAEAGIHASAALLNMQLKHENLTEFINWHVVNQLLKTNFGVEGTAWLKAVPLTNENAMLYKELLVALMADPGAGPEIKDAINARAMMDAIGVPVESPDEGEPSDTAHEVAPSAPDIVNGAPQMNGHPSRFTISVS